MTQPPAPLAAVEPVKEGVPAASRSGLGQRSWQDSQAPMGYGTSRVLDRVLASFGLLGSADLRFAPADDVAYAGVLLALPALLTEGLLRHTRQFYSLPPGYYPLEAIFLYLALLALARCPSLEQTRYQAPGEWGRLLGLDRLPEVKTLRQKISLLCEEEGRAGQWQSRLAKEWMEGVVSAGTDPEAVGLFYVDGHVRVYHGKQGPLPRLYVAREKLLLRGTIDYWVNGLGGQPFFVVTQPINAGLIRALEETVIPRLLADAPQPEGWDKDPLAMCFTLAFDREGYSPKFFADLTKQRIGVLSYRKYCGENWPAEVFTARSVRLPGGQVVEKQLAEREVQLSNGLWMREARELEADGSQSSILSNDWRLGLSRILVLLPARWSQENFLKYMREHFGLDQLIEYGTKPILESTVVVNPAHRRLEQKIRTERARLQRLEAQFGSHNLPRESTPEEVEDFTCRGGQLRQQIEQQSALLQELTKQRAETPRKLTLKELPESERYRQLCPESKHFIDTIKMIAYRAESALAGELQEHLGREDDVRALLRRVFATPANLRPNYGEKTLVVELHRLGSALQDAAVAKLCEQLTATETQFPTTDLRLIYRQVGSS